ncbi:phosphogluconate dehydratase [Sulfuricurvum sp.]|uniref:phosphogluconate dehydratase n=1 Tax=Sulfuricurvum sp. TaxID=2025608 RepID=UPI002614E0BE|nr:phosphogluconate dehydratase [Sulfuricurvum sp.]MDD2781113.1 phosphogluconate dehydratase [Sulfuricurvum sp.]
MNPIIQRVTEQIRERSLHTRALYLQRLGKAKTHGVNRQKLGCSNLAHAMAPMDDAGKTSLSQLHNPNIAIVTAYNDMLSAHEPYKLYPSLIKRTLADAGATCQVAGGVPAMCDGVTQSQPGMELSLFSRDNIAMGTAIALSHNVYDGALYLGICDKIVPGLVIGALTFGHLPAVFIPAGPMPSGISNAEKAHIRQEFAKGNITEDALLKAEAASYHSSGTCTFYGTANSNQMLLEMMGLQLPNSSFVNTNTPLREALTAEAAKRILTMTEISGDYKPIGEMIDERSFVNAIIGLMATGGSTNHTLHLIAMAKAAGIHLTWDDFDQLSKVTPLLCRMYPNGNADVNAFRDAGGMSVVIHQLLNAGLAHNDVETIMGRGLDRYSVEPTLSESGFAFISGPHLSRDTSVISSAETPFSPEGGLKLLVGNIGRSVIKTSALKDKNLIIEAEAIVFDSQEALQEAFKRGELERDFIAVVRFQGPRANGMPELHGLMPPLGVLQERGFNVAIITDGRMSGASGKVASAIHMSPEASRGGVLAKINSGDKIRFDVQKGEITLLVDPKILEERSRHVADMEHNRYGFGRELFSAIRSSVKSAEEGAGIFESIGEERA